MLSYGGNQERLDGSTRPYRVFINHRGPDVKETLATTIYHSLQHTGLNVFFDKTEFQPGQKLLPTIKEAIRTASVHIAIFSPRYAESPWCLEELCLMLGSGGKIIPVFYRVSPSDLVGLKYGKGIYVSAFNKGKFKVFYADRLQEWKEALEEVSNISGLELNSSTFNGDEEKLLQALRRAVIEHVREQRTKFDHGLVGLDKIVDSFNCFMSKSSKHRGNCKTVGIVGTVGSGKTTLAEEYFYRNRESFDRSSFLFGVREASERNGLQALQRLLLKDLTCDSHAEINTVREGIEILADRLDCLSRHKQLKFLIVIDDVDDHKQLEALLLKDNILGSGSLVIVTSRDKAVLKLSGISVHYEVEPLAMEDAAELLRRSAFKDPEAVTDFDRFIQIAVIKSGGVPLFLKRIGWNLMLYGGNNEETWERELISEIPEILNASYGALGEEEKQIFLDIACFFVGMEKNSAIRVWAGLGWEAARALRKLEYMCLLQIDENNCLKMNNHHSSLGREIADKQLCNSLHLPCRLWRSNEAQNSLRGLLSLPESTKLRFTDATRIYERRSGTHTFSSVKIELLEINGDISRGEVLIDLAWLRWRDCPHTSIPRFEMNNLRVLELVGGSLEDLWGPGSELPVQLREINVKYCSELATIPPTIMSLQRLEKMTLDDLPRVTTLPEEFCELGALKHLVLKECASLTCLPNGFGKLTNLEHIDFSYCQNLLELPQSFGCLIQLKCLDVEKCKNLIVGADRFENIRTLEELNFENCTGLQRLPNKMTSQNSLRKLNLLGTSLEELPHDFYNLTKLEELRIGSPFFTSIPSNLENLSCLSVFEICMFGQMNCSPPSKLGHLILSDFFERTTEEAATEVNTICVYGLNDRMQP
ncbi:hypothetical protein SUGI_0689080 [Cryptomeria japonica]|nr:hypothetical protein SUGI_0689080 [Cryptomeria japonica]